MPASVGLAEPSHRGPYPADGCWDDKSCWFSSTRTVTASASAATATASGTAPPYSKSNFFVREIGWFSLGGVGLIMLLAVVVKIISLPPSEKKLRERGGAGRGNGDGSGSGNGNGRGNGGVSGSGGVRNNISVRQWEKERERREKKEKDRKSKEEKKLKREKERLEKDEEKKAKKLVKARKIGVASKGRALGGEEGVELDEYPVNAERDGDLEEDASSTGFDERVGNWDVVAGDEGGWGWGAEDHESGRDFDEATLASFV